MDCTCVRQTELPHTSRLFADYVYHPERVARFYPGGREPVPERVKLAPERRAALVEALAPLNRGSAALEKLARPDTVAVVTGQQVGLFSGPSYTVYKALTAVRLAAQLEERGTPAVPVFWLATEDHDFAEVNHNWVFDSEHHPRKLEMKRAAAAGQPVGEIALANPPVEELRAALAGFPFGEDVAAMVARAYAPGRSMGQAFGALLRELLAGFDLVQIDPMAPAVRELAAPALRAAVESAPELTAGVLERNRELTEAGYHAQVHVEESTSFVFLLENGRRLPLKRHGHDYMQEGRRFTTEELAARARELSPNALLRPVVQDTMLPTVAYVGGPAELAYLAQSEVIYRRILGRMPAAVPRAGFTLLDQRSAKLMERYGLKLETLFPGEDALREAMAARLIPPAVRAVVAGTRTTIEAAVDRLAAELKSFDPSLAKALERSRSKMRYQAGKIERKVGREAMARDERAARDAAYLYGLIYPDRHLQERIYSILPFVARHGLELIGRLYEDVRLECPDHRLAVI